MTENEFLIQPDQISKEALENIIKEYVLREGTDYGDRNLSMESKIKQVLVQLKNKDAFILYNNELGSFNILSKEEVVKLSLK